MKNPTMLKLKGKLLTLLEELIQDGVTIFISGGALGLDQAAFWCVHILKKKYPHVKNIVAIPFENQPRKWNQESQGWYQKMLNLADEVIDVSKQKDYDSGESERLPFEAYSPKKMFLRNNYMVDHSEILIAVYDGTSGGTGHCYNYTLKKKDKDRLIYVLNPLDDFELTKIETNV